MIAAGRCAGTCGREVWKAVNDPKTSERILLWPRPWSRYPVFVTADGHEAPGIAYCTDCCPRVGDDGPDGATVTGVAVALGRVTSIAHPKHRYAKWYSAEHGVFLRAWLADHLDLDTERAGTIDAVMAEWAKDRAA